VLVCVLSLFAFCVQATLVKKSSSGLCHPPASSYYDRTDNFTAFSSVEACLQSGGRLPKGLNLASDSSTADEYARSHFGHGWADTDSDCRNSRMEALIEQSTSPVRFASRKQCRVVSGRWISPFTGNVIHDASQVDVDHVVPLKWAWERGADQWPQAKRERFANDPVNLWSVEASLNRQKGAKGPDEWMPPYGQCQYTSRFLRISKMYDLNPIPEVTRIFKRLLARYCR